MIKSSILYSSTLVYNQVHSTIIKPSTILYSSTLFYNQINQVPKWLRWASKRVLVAKGAWMPTHLMEGMRNSRNSPITLCHALSTALRSAWRCIGTPRGLHLEQTKSCKLMHKNNISTYVLVYTRMWISKRKTQRHSNSEKSTRNNRLLFSVMVHTCAGLQHSTRRLKQGETSKEAARNINVPCRSDVAYLF